MSDSFLSPLSRVEHELVVNKSRFIAWVAPVTERGQAMALLDEARRDYPDARHHCWAYVLGNPRNAASAAANDDGEPAGTAGKPILNVIQHKGIGNIMVVVIRYFGGIKLGAGGLVRAYSGVTQQATEQLKLIEHWPQSTLSLVLPYALEPSFRRWMENHKVLLVKVEYTTNIKMTIAINTKSEPLLFDWLAGREGAHLLRP